MKTILLFILLPFAAISQRTGTFAMNGVIIIRNDSIEIADYGSKQDTCMVTWLSDKVYTVKGKEGLCTVTITASGKWGYKGYAVMGDKKAKIEAIKIKE